MKKRYAFKDFPHRDTVNSLNDGSTERIYVPLVLSPDCPSDLMEKVDSIINSMIASRPDQKYDTSDLFIYVQLWITILRSGRIVHEIDTGILSHDETADLYNRYVVLCTDPVYPSYKRYFSDYLFSLLFDEKASITRAEVKHGIYHVNYDRQRKMYMVEHTSIYSEELEPPRYFSTEHEAQEACRALSERKT